MIDERAMTAIATAGATLLTSYFALAAPAEKQADLDRDANWTCRSELVEVKAERDEWIARYLDEEDSP